MVTSNAKSPATLSVVFSATITKICRSSMYNHYYKTNGSSNKLLKMKTRMLPHWFRQCRKTFLVWFSLIAELITNFFRMIIKFSTIAFLTTMKTGNAISSKVTISVFLASTTKTEWIHLINFFAMKKSAERMRIKVANSHFVAAVVKLIWWLNSSKHWEEAIEADFLHTFPLIRANFKDYDQKLAKSSQLWSSQSWDAETRHTSSKKKGRQKVKKPRH